MSSRASELPRPNASGRDELKAVAAVDIDKIEVVCLIKLKLDNEVFHTRLPMIGLKISEM